MTQPLRPTSGGPCLVYLVRAANDPALLRSFAESLRHMPPGEDYQLVLAMKGFSAEDAQRHLRNLADLKPLGLTFADEGLDLGVYLSAAAQLQRERYCFLNSFSRPLVQGWLDKLDAALALPGVGMTSASGSWASVPSWLAYAYGLPSAYRGLLPEPHVARGHFLALELERAGAERRAPADALRVRLRTLRELPVQLTRFERFPAHHLRTNAFMISGDVLRRLRLRSVRRKMDAYQLESGRHSLTRQVQRLGLRTVVVDRAGVAYDHEQWDRSRTLWQGDQDGLLVADNQTLAYAHGGADRRRLLSAFAWGLRADPDLSRERAS
jgi:hypothetical protein